MLITADLLLPFPRSLVYITYRDKLPDLVSYLPNIRSIKVKSRHQENGLTYLIVFWRGGGKIPLPLRATLGEAMLSWTEYDTWDESNFTLDWHIKTDAFTEAVFCQGQNYFLEKNNNTIISTRGELKISPEQIEGFPQPLRNKIASLVENFLGKKILANLIQMNEGVRNYLENALSDANIGDRS